MKASSAPAGNDDHDNVVVPLHRGRLPAPPGPAPTSWRAFDSTARKDPLTNLHGHPWFEEDLRGAGRRRRSGENPWVAIASVEGLAELERHLDADVAAEALRAISVRLNDSLRAGDKIARLGEDRFGLVVDAPFAGEAIGALERIERSVRELTSAHPRWLGLTLRVGLAPLWGSEPEAAVRQAESALDAARRRGSPVMMSTDGRP